jgi:pimeloyl-ACP methyl ester carboxylesterase
MEMRGALDNWGGLADEFVEKTGWNIWMVDYPGYGKSTGKISSEAQLHDVADAVYAEAVKLNPGKKIVVWGRSLGSGIAAPIAAKNSIQGLVLETPFYSLKDMAGIYFPYLPSFLLRYPFPTNAVINNVKAPLFLLHGTADRVIPYAQGKMLFDDFKGKKEMLTIEGGVHNTLSEDPQFWPGVINFLKSL